MAVVVVGILKLELVLYSPGSLKEKRGIVRKLLDRCRVRFPVSCAETGLQDLWQRAEFGFSVVHHQEDAVRSIFEQIEEEIVRHGTADISAREVEVFHF